jgi:IS4 transposase
MFTTHSNIARGKENAKLRRQAEAETQKITMKVIPSKNQRYDTCGDYWQGKDGVEFRVSNLGDWRMHVLVLIHEFAEWAMLKDRGISIDDVDKFDMNFEKERERGLHKPSEEPGDAKDCPYRKEHAIATKIEKLMAKELGIDWDKYGKAVDESSQTHFVGKIQAVI